MAGKAGDEDGEDTEEPDDEGMGLDIPEVSASKIIERSAEIGRPGKALVRKV
jgi:hypothetical protein